MNWKGEFTMLNNFRVLSALCSLGALLIIAGFFLTMLPIGIQIVLLFAGFVTCCITMYGIVMFYSQFAKTK